MLNAVITAVAHVIFFLTSFIIAYILCVSAHLLLLHDGLVYGWEFILAPKNEYADIELATTTNG